MTVLPEVRQELYETAARRAARPRLRRWIGPGLLLLAGGTAAALLVAVVAVIGLSTGKSTVTAPARPASASVRTLEDRLAILRRSQTAADRTYPASLSVHRPLAQPLRFVPRLARLAAVIDTPTVGRVRVFMIVRVVQSATVPGVCGAGSGRTCPGAPAGHTPAPARRPVHVIGQLGHRGTALVSLVAVAGRGLPAALNPYGSTGGTVSAGSGEQISQMQDASQLDQPGAVTSGLLSAAGNGPNPDVGVNMSVVPDGVTRVKWVFTGAAFGVSDPRPITVYPTVHDNVAVAPVTPGEGPIARAVWYGASGRVIAASSGGADARQRLRLIQAVNASRQNALPRWLVQHFALFRTVPPTTPVRNPAMNLDIDNGGFARGLGLNEWQVRHVSGVTGIDGPGLWITPGTRGICVDDPSAGGCGQYRPTRPLDSGGFTAGSAIASPGEVGPSGTVRKWAETMSGLVPDGNATVTVLLAGGSRRVVPVVENVWEVTVPRRIVGVIDHNATGQLKHWSIR